MKVPYFVWTLVLVIAAAVLQANFEHAEWYQTALILIFAVARMIDMTGDTEKEIKDVLDRESSTRGFVSASKMLVIKKEPFAKKVGRFMWGA